MKNIKTFEGFFDKFKKNQKEEPKLEEPKVEKISIPDNKYSANKDEREDFYYIWSGWGFGGGRPFGTIKKLEDSNFLMKHDGKNIKLPSVERGLEYLKELDDEREINSNKIDIDLTK